MQATGRPSEEKCPISPLAHLRLLIQNIYLCPGSKFLNEYKTKLQVFKMAYGACIWLDVQKPNHPKNFAPFFLSLVYAVIFLIDK